MRSVRGGFFLNGMSITNKLIFVNVLVYIFSMIMLFVVDENIFVNSIALTPSFIVSGQNLWTLITSMFSHFMFFHIFANMFSLFFIGNFLEKLIGKKRLFLIYIFSGLVGGLFFVASGIIFSNANIPGVGASGAIFGLLGVLSVLVPYSRIYLIAGPLIVLLAQVALSPIVPANLAGAFNLILNILIFGMIFAMFSFSPTIRKFAVPVELKMWILPFVAIVPLVVVGFFVDLPIGNSAHIGGLLLGIAYGFYLRKKFPNKTKMLSRHFR